MAQPLRRRSMLITGAIRACRARRGHAKVTDTTGAKLTGGDLLVRSLVLRRLLRRGVLAPDERHVGILLPPSAGAVAANLALTLDGRVVANLNYTLTAELINTCIRQAGIRHVLTSRRFMERVPLALECELVYLEDFRDAAKPLDKAIGAALGYGLPAPLLTRLLGHHAGRDDDAMAVLFTSGTTGEPKGVLLTYANIESNVDAVDLVIHTRHDDVLIGILPFFHAFGYTVTLWIGLTRDIEVAYHVNPLEANVVGRLTRERKGTILLSTPMFLRNFTRRVEPEEFATLDIVITGGEHLPQPVAEAFEAKFGIHPLEGYGCTEMSPFVAANIPKSRAVVDDGFLSRQGTVGKVAPGVRVNLVDPETGEPTPAGERGMLLATGPNVMAGYIGNPEATAKAIRDGWYVTGDLAIIDEDGFITIVGRESRFAKIGGEMVSHLAIEEALVEVVGTTEDGGPKLVVVSIPDPDRGERLVVVHTGLAHTPDELRRALAARGLPNLYIPSASSFVPIDALPTVGTGKLDLGKIRQHAINALTPTPSPATAGEGGTRAPLPSRRTMGRG